ncbi:hypothetical protein [Microbacterium gorillae]|uniref:hypothetical protein n=1 Tax=Microbacterium gorillae TaxID=1231063 RepID=UPI003D998465
MTSGPLVAEPAFATTEVHPADVHKIRAESVWLASAQAVSARTVSAAFRIPTTSAEHARFAEVLEVQRQVGMLQLTRQASLPDSDVFILNRISLRLLGHANAPTNGIVHSHIVSGAAIDGGKRSFHQRFGFESEDGLVATGRSHATFIPRPLYERLRSNRPRPAAISNTDAGQELEPLDFSEDDPILSDHPSDHITAMQVAVAVEHRVGNLKPGAKLTALRLRFDHYIETRPLPLLAVEFRPGNKFSGQVRQNGVSMASFGGSAIHSDLLRAE